MALLDTLQLIFYLIAYYALGRISLVGWRGRINPILKFFLTFPLGFLAVLISPAILGALPIKVPFISELIAAMIVACFLALALFFISIGIEAKPIQPYELRELIEEFEQLKQEFIQLKQFLAKKKLIPEKLEEEEAVKALEGELKEKGIRGFKILEKVEELRNWKFLIQAGRKRFVALIDAFSGKLTKFAEERGRVGKVVDYFSKNKVALAGVLILMVLGALAVAFSGEISKILQEQLRLFGFQRICNQSCLSPSCLLDLIEWGKIGQEEYMVTFERNDELLEIINSSVNDEAIVIMSVNVDKKYLLVVSLTTTQMEKFMGAMVRGGMRELVDFVSRNLNTLENVEICSITENINCGCEKFSRLLFRIAPIIYGKSS